MIFQNFICGFDVLKKSFYLRNALSKTIQNIIKRKSGNAC